VAIPNGKAISELEEGEDVPECMTSKRDHEGNEEGRTLGT